MTITTNYTQSFAFSLTAYSMSRGSASTNGDSAQTPPVSASTLPASAPASAPVSDTPASAPVDRVELSSAATAQATLPTASRTPQGGDALFSALDANKDGSITEQEFTDGATALLRRAGARQHHHRVHADDDMGQGSQDVKRAGRLERTLEKLFDRVDANHDGSVDKGELANALAQVNGGQAPSGVSTTSAPQTTPATSDPVPPAAAPDAPGTPAPVAPAEGQPVASASVTSVIYVAIAVQQYTAIGDMR